MGNTTGAGLFKKLEEERSKWMDHELSDEEFDKLKGDPVPGGKVKIIWPDEYEEEKFDDIEDYGYVFELPGMHADECDCFIHIPLVANPSGKEAAEPEWIYLISLLANKNCKEVICTP